MDLIEYQIALREWAYHNPSVRSYRERMENLPPFTPAMTYTPKLVALQTEWLTYWLPKIQSAVRSFGLGFDIEATPLKLPVGKEQKYLEYRCRRIIAMAKHLTREETDKN